MKGRPALLLLAALLPALGWAAPFIPATDAVIVQQLPYRLDPAERARRAQGLRDIVTSRDPGDWIDEQLADIRAKARAQ